MIATEEKSESKAELSMSEVKRLYIGVTLVFVALSVVPLLGIWWALQVAIEYAGITDRPIYFVVLSICALNNVCLTIYTIQKGWRDHEHCRILHKSTSCTQGYLMSTLRDDWFFCLISIFLMPIAIPYAIVAGIRRAIKERKARKELARMWREDHPRT